LFLKSKREGPEDRPLVRKKAAELEAAGKDGNIDIIQQKLLHIYKILKTHHVLIIQNFLDGYYIIIPVFS
jgi:hypothetical protein